MKKRRSNAVMGMSFFTPALILMIVFLFVPMILIVVYSFTDYFALSPDNTHFVGLENFKKIFKDELFTKSFWNTMVLPMSKTVVATVSVFTFLGVWNDYLWPSLVFTSSDLLTAQIGLNSITSNDNTTMGQTLAVITMITIPVIIIYSLFSKQIVEGVVSTGSKEG